MEHSKGSVFRYPVIRASGSRCVEFVKYFRNMYGLPENGKFLRALDVRFQFAETDDSVCLLFNRKYNKKEHDVVKVFTFNGVKCFKINKAFIDSIGLESVEDPVYIKVTDDQRILISKYNDTDSVREHLFGTIDNCVIPLYRVKALDNNISEYFIKYDCGICNMIPFLYPDEVSVLSNGNGVYVSVEPFYDKIKKEVDGEKVLVSVIFNDKDQRIEFMK